MKEIEELIEISRKYGKDSRYVIAGGGNTSYKNAEKLWVKASGCALATITEDGFAVLDRKKLNVISEKTYSSDTAAREEEVKNDLAAACITKDRRPSVETSMHNALEANFIVHLHPTMVNGLMCGQNAEAETQKLFGDDAVYIPYTDPGYVLFKEVENRINAYKAKFGKEPAILPAAEPRHLRRSEYDQRGGSHLRKSARNDRKGGRRETARRRRSGMRMRSGSAARHPDDAQQAGSQNAESTQ